MGCDQQSEGDASSEVIGKEESNKASLLSWPSAMGKSFYFCTTPCIFRKVTRVIAYFFSGWRDRGWLDSVTHHKQGRETQKCTVFTILQGRCDFVLRHGDNLYLLLSFNRVKHELQTVSHAAYSERNKIQGKVDSCVDAVRSFPRSNERPSQIAWPTCICHLPIAPSTFSFVWTDFFFVLSFMGQSYCRPTFKWAPVIVGGGWWWLCVARQVFENPQGHTVQWNFRPCLFPFIEKCCSPSVLFKLGEIWKLYGISIGESSLTSGTSKSVCCVLFFACIESSLSYWYIADGVVDTHGES